MSIKEYSLSVNNFNEPKKSEDAQGLLLLLSRLMLLEPGTFQSHPDMGVGLLTNFRYRLDDGSLISDLQSRIETQIATYLPMLTGVDVKVELKHKTFFINITIDGIIYGMLYDTRDNSIQTNYSAITDL